jgi:hypothetical protein
VSDSQCSVEESDFTRGYDAENHTISVDSATAHWAPSGQPYELTGGSVPYFLHYDDDTLLFVTDPQGGLLDLKMETFGDVNQTGQLTVWDRDHAGMLRSGHNNSIYYGVNFGTAVWPALKGQSSNPASPVYFSGSANAPSCVTSCGIGQILPYNRLEGFDWSGVTIQGARVVDSSTGQWTTPDAYAGDVHDPMSQKPYMWDRNNPYEYSDPSGYCIWDLCIVEGIGVTELVLTGLTLAAGAVAGVEASHAAKHAMDKFAAGSGGISAPLESRSRSKGASGRDVTGTEASGGAEHTKGGRKSTQEAHENGLADKNSSRGGEAGDARRNPARKPHQGHKGPYPPDSNKPLPKCCQ